MGRIGWSDIRDASFPAAGSAKTIINSASGQLDAYGTEKPADGLAGYAKGGTFKDVTAGKVYINQGTNTSCSFKEIEITPAVAGSASGRGPSPLIWDSCPVLDFILDPTQGWTFFDDFIVDAPLLAANQAGVAIGSGWWGHTSATAGSTITPQTDHANGEVHLLTTTTDEVAILEGLCGHNTTGHVKFTAGKKTWFEARVAVTNVTNAKCASFVGFAEEGLLGNATLLNANQALVDKDFIGFAQLVADGDAWQTRFNTASGGVGVDGTTVSATADVIVTTVMAKLGIYCDGVTIFFYADGVLLANSVTLATANVPDGEELALYFATGSVDADDCVLGIDWVRVAQEI